MNKIIKLLEEAADARAIIPNEIHRHTIHLIDLEYALKLAYIDAKYWHDTTKILIIASFVVIALIRTAL